MKQDGEFAPALTQMGNLLFEAGSLEKAEKYYLKAIQCSAGQDAQAFAGLGNIKMELSESDIAI